MHGRPISSFCKLYNEPTGCCLGRGLERSFTDWRWPQNRTLDPCQDTQDNNHISVLLHQLIQFPQELNHVDTALGKDTGSLNRLGRGAIGKLGNLIRLR